MISFDQVLLLEEKVEGAVKRIEQLNAENAALREKCAELSNALAAKSEQFSSFESDQSKIEEGILKALSRLSAVENVVLSAAAQAPSSPAERGRVSHEADEGQDTDSSISSEGMEAEPGLDSQDEVSEAQLRESPEGSSLAPDVDFEFGESEQEVGDSSEPLPQEDARSADGQDSDPFRQLFDIF